MEADAYPSAESMLSPFKGTFQLTSPRGYRILDGIKEYHKGLDLVGMEDSTIYAVADGVAYTLYEKNGFGYYVRQLLSDGRRIYYGHMKSFLISSGEYVEKGRPLGVMGATGRATGTHVHLELRPQGYSSDSLDISAFTGIPNCVGTYCAANGTAPQKNVFSYDDTIDRLMRCGIITQENMVSWELMLSGRAPLKTEYVREIFDRCGKKLSELSGIA